MVCCRESCKQGRLRFIRSQAVSTLLLSRGHLRQPWAESDTRLAYDFTPSHWFSLRASSCECAFASNNPLRHMCKLRLRLEGRVWTVSRWGLRVDIVDTKTRFILDDGRLNFDDSELCVIHLGTGGLMNRRRMLERLGSPDWHIEAKPLFAF